MSEGHIIHSYSCYSRAAGSARVRLFDWFEHLNVNVCHHVYSNTPSVSMKTLLGNPSSVVRAERSLRAHDGISIVSREASPLSAGHLESKIFARSERGVYDLDDALYNDRRLRRSAFGGDRKFERMVRSADSVIVGNDYLAEWAERYSSSVTVIPSCVQVSEYRVAQHDDNAPRVMVWLGSPSTEQYLATIAPMLKRVHETTGARLRVISGPSHNPHLAEIDHLIDRVAWSQETYAELLAGATVGISPLLNTDFARGKCAYKILQYGAAGLPVVGDPVGANAIALERLGGVAVRHPNEWVEALEAILSLSGDGLREIGGQARSSVSKHYSFAAWEKEWVSAVSG